MQGVGGGFGGAGEPAFSGGGRRGRLAASKKARRGDSMSDKASEAQETPPKAGLVPKGELLSLLRRLAAALPLDERRALAMSLIENEADEITFRRGGTTWTIAPWDT